MEDKAAKSILTYEFPHIYKTVERVDTILGVPLKIVLNGSLAIVYRPSFETSRLITTSRIACWAY
jgi:hypothetical protein